MSTHWQPGSIDLPASGVTAGTYGDATHVGQVTVAASGLVTAASDVLITGGGGGGGGGEIGYAQITSPVNVTDTSESTATAIISPGALTFDGGPVVVEVYFPYAVPPSGTPPCYLIVTLWEGATQLGRLIYVGVQATGFTEVVTPYGQYRFTPSAGSHTYKVSAFVANTTGTPSLGAGAGGTGAYLPAFVRFTKV